MRGNTILIPKTNFNYYLLFFDENGKNIVLKNTLELNEEFYGNAERTIKTLFPEHKFETEGIIKGEY